MTTSSTVQPLYASSPDTGTSGALLRQIPHNAEAEQALAVVREVLERFAADGPTQAELDAAKANMVGGFALQLDSNKKLLGQVANIAWNDLPLDYLDTWQARVQAIPLEQVKAAFARVVNPQRMATVVLGATPAKTAPQVQGQ